MAHQHDSALLKPFNDGVFSLKLKYHPVVCDKQIGKLFHVLSNLTIFVLRLYLCFVDTDLSDRTTLEKFGEHFT